MAMEMAMATLIGTFFLVKKFVPNRVEKNRLSLADDQLDVLRIMKQWLKEGADVDVNVDIDVDVDVNVNVDVDVVDVDVSGR